LQTVPLKKNSNGDYTETAQKWIKPPYETYLQFWFFDVVNADDVALRGARPHVVQRGPYGYRCADRLAGGKPTCTRVQ
jgi:hypothetical protein